ncbi:hypothetical protein GE21DRAFT_1307970 [Neurospora crassa]|nr:hypothetical protein GE21DRAFT_1307970 [Neurospora crassa]
MARPHATQQGETAILCGAAKTQPSSLRSRRQDRPGLLSNTFGGLRTRCGVYLPLQPAKGSLILVP